MYQIEKNKIKSALKCVTLIILFTLLTLDITKNLIDAYAITSIEPKLCVPIIMYHQVKLTRLGKDVISPTEFESDLKYLSDNDYHTITMTQLIDYVYNGAELPQNPIILTFDDGYYSTYKYVFPLLEKYDMNIVLSIIGKTTDDFTRVEDTNIGYAHSSWSQLYEMVQSGHVEIQNHTYNLHNICNGRYGCYQMKNESSSNYEKFLSDDLLALQDRIFDKLKVTPNTFTYPYGKYNNNTEAIVKKLGFKATLSCEFGVNLIERNSPESLYSLKRICRSHNNSIKTVIKNGMKTIKHIQN